MRRWTPLLRRRSWGGVMRGIVGGGLAVSAVSSVSAANAGSAGSEDVRLPPPGESTRATESVLRLDEVILSVNRAFPLLRAAELERALADGEWLAAEGGFDVAWKTRGSVTPIGAYNSVRVDSLVEKPTSLWGSSVFAGWKLGTGDFPIYDGKFQTLDGGEFRAGVNVPLWRNGPIDRRRANLGKAELGKHLANLTVDQQRIEVRRAATHRYWVWVAAGRRVAIGKTLLDNVLTRDVGVRARVEHGDLAPIEQIDNARAIEQRRAQLAMAQRGVEQAAIELSLYVRDTNGEPMAPRADRLPSGLPEVGEASSTLREDVALALGGRPEPKRARLQLRQQGFERDWAKNQLAPGLDLQIMGSQDVGPALDSRPDLRKPVLEAVLLLDVPLQTRLMRGRADVASAGMARLAYQEQFARDRVVADVRDAHSALRGARERIEAARREIRFARDLEEAERVRFEQGDSQLLIVNLREQQTAEAELREVDALLDYHRALADKKAARGE